MDIPCLSPKCLEDTQVFAWGMCAANTPLWELSMLHYGAKLPKETEEKGDISRLFCYSDTTFSCSLLHTTTCANFEAIHHVPRGGAAMYGGAQFLAPSRRLFLQMYDETLLLSSLDSRLDVCNPHRIFIEGACQLPSFYSILTDNNSEKCKHFWKI